MVDDTSGETRIVPKKGRSGDSIIPVTIRAKVVVMGGVDSGKEFRIDGVEMLIGRGEDVQIKLNDDVISRHHAQISFNNMEFRIKDLGSANGTVLNGSDVSEYALRHNDKILVGETMLKFTVDRI